MFTANSNVLSRKGTIDRTAEYLNATIESLKLIARLTETASPVQKVLWLPYRAGCEGKKTLVLDLDETLVHCCLHSTEPPEKFVQIPLENGTRVSVGINIRPFVEDFLVRVSQIFEVVIFTASHQHYADAVLDTIDPKKRLIHHRLYRQHCVHTGDVYMKDLRILANRNIEKVAIVDNSVHSFGAQLDNGIPILSWYDDYTDSQLVKLLPYLEELSGVSDVRVLNRETFGLRKFCEQYLKSGVSPLQ